MFVVEPDEDVDGDEERNVAMRVLTAIALASAAHAEAATGRPHVAPLTVALSMGAEPKPTAICFTRKEALVVIKAAYQGAKAGRSPMATADNGAERLTVSHGEAGHSWMIVTQNPDGSVVRIASGAQGQRRDAANAIAAVTIRR